MTVQNARFDAAQALHQHGKLAEARALYEEILSMEPRHFGALHFLGMIAAQTGSPVQGAELMAQSLSLNRNNAIAFNNYGNVLAQLQRHEDAIESYDRAIALAPNFADAYYNRGLALVELGRFAAALENYDQALLLAPRSAEALYNRGIAHYRLQQRDSALHDFEAAIALDPGHAKAHSNRGLILHQMKRLEGAMECFDRALALQPGLADAHSNRGNVLRDLRRLEAAVSNYDRALELRPDFAEAFYNRGVALRELQRHEAAIADFERATAIRPSYAEAFNSLGNAQLDLGRIDGAIEGYEKAAALDPSLRFLGGVLCHARMRVCDWENWQRDLDVIVDGIEGGRPVAPPFAVLALIDSPKLHAKAAAIWVREEHPASHLLPPIAQRPRRDRIRVAYLSADFRDHPVAALTAELIEIHDRASFELFGLSFRYGSADAMALRMERAFDRFIDVRDKSDLEIAKLARDLGIDIAVDLGGYTRGSRPGIFALRAAPVQISYLGYLGTMSAAYIDYLLADPLIIPPDSTRHYREKIIQLPSYQVNDSKRSMAERRFARADCGLPPYAFVYCCFNAAYKITPDMFASWMRILARVKDGVLLLYCDQASAIANLRREAGRNGIDPDRLIFGRRLSRPEYLARYLVADLFLDTLPYNAGATASDALWAGLPVLTRIGDAFAGRIAASLLNSIGLPELITTTSAQYEDLAVALAVNPAQLAELRRRLAANRAAAPLFDTPAFARRLEAAFTIVHERSQAGLPVDHVALADIEDRAAATVQRRA